MTDALIEAVARAIVSYEGDPDGICDRTEKYRGQEINSQCKAWETRIDRARAALAAIEQSGYAVVPVRANFITGRSPLNISDIEPAGEGAVYIDGLTLDEAWQLLKVKR